jgi:uncharacterized lipoprotein YmbA
VRFYVLSAPSGVATAAPVAATERGLTTGIGPDTLPRYLDRPQIGTSTSRSALNVAEFDRWAELLEPNYVRVLAEDLAPLIPTARLLVFRWPGSTPIGYRVKVR